jgi:hypothetical protein
MIGEVVKRLVKDLDELVSEEDLGQPFFSAHNYRPYPFDVNYFSPINSVESKRKSAFIDGGNRELVGAPNFSIQLNRVYFNIFHGKQRVLEMHIPQRIEFFSATFTTFKDDEIFFNTSIFSVPDIYNERLPDSADLSFSSTDRHVMIGVSRADITRVASIARRFAEWEYAKHIIKNELDSGDVIVMDGTLRTMFKNESKYANEAYEAAKRKGVVYSGLSKTSRLFTDTGLSLLGAVRKMATDTGVGPTWYYYPVAKSLSPEHQGTIIIVKLNEQSERVFNYELYAEQFEKMDNEEINEILSQLCINSCDASFPGYPYGLIDADDKARVRREDVQIYKVLLLSEVSKLGSWPKFSRHIQSTDAHDVLNMLKGGT